MFCIIFEGVPFGTGGFSMSGSSFAATTNYYIKVSFDGGVNWYPLTGGTATTGSWLGSGFCFTHVK